MAGLPKSIIKQYGVSKKAWAVFRAGRSSSKSTRKSRKAQARNRGVSMAKKKKSGFRRGSMRGLGGDFAVMLGAAAYGAGREYVSERLTPYTNKLGVFGDLSDEAGMLALSYLLWKKKIPMIKKFAFASQIGHAGVVIECARIGQYAALRATNTTTGTSTMQGEVLTFG